MSNSPPRIEIKNSHRLHMLNISTPKLSVAKPMTPLPVAKPMTPLPPLPVVKKISLPLPSNKSTLPTSSPILPLTLTSNVERPVPSSPRLKKKTIGTEQKLTPVFTPIKTPTLESPVLAFKPTNKLPIIPVKSSHSKHSSPPLSPKQSPSLPPLSLSPKQKLFLPSPKKLTSEEVQEMCCVCMDGVPVQQKLRCKHDICIDCMKQLQKPECPVCRKYLEGPTVTEEVLNELAIRELEEENKRETANFMVALYLEENPYADPEEAYNRFYANQ